jgi:hypothetical protein
VSQAVALDGARILPPPASLLPWREEQIDADTARPKDATARMNFGYVVSAVLDNVQRIRTPRGATA